MLTGSKLKTLLASTLLGSAFLTGCLPVEGFKQSAIDGQPRGYDINMYPINKVACDPMGGDHDPGLTGGLKADLYYLGDNERYYTVNEYIEKGKKSSEMLFFSDVNVPTRIFDQGFPKEAGGIIQTEDKKDLFEYFALSFKTVLRLSNEDPEGTYEFALLSDDGAILSIRNYNGQYEELVNNDGDHPTLLACGGTMQLTRDSQIVTELNYYQGPRYHISVIPLWRKVTAETKAEPFCGQTGNDYWFNSANSSPQKPYKDLLARGWRPIAPQNYELPQSVALNPCTEGIRPVISNFQASFQGNKIVATWTTNIPAASQLRYIHQDTGEDKLTLSDNILRTQHRVETTEELLPGWYKVQGVAISDSYGKAFSSMGDVLVTSF